MNTYCDIEEDTIIILPSEQTPPVHPASHVHCPGCVQMPFSQGGLHIGVLQAVPIQPFTHVHCPGCVQMPISQGGLHIGVLQAVPFQPSTHVHVPGDVHVPPLAHVWLQTAVQCWMRITCSYTT